MDPIILGLVDELRGSYADIGRVCDLANYLELLPIDVVNNGPHLCTPSKSLLTKCQKGVQSFFWQIRAVSEGYHAQDNIFQITRIMVKIMLQCSKGSEKGLGCSSLAFFAGGIE